MEWRQVHDESLACNRLRRIYRSTIRPHHIRLPQDVMSDRCLDSCRTSGFREFSTHVQVLQQIQSAVPLPANKIANREAFTHSGCDVIPPFREHVFKCQFSDPFRVEPCHKLVHLLLFGQLYRGCAAELSYLLGLRVYCPLSRSQESLSLFLLPSGINVILLSS